LALGEDPGCFLVAFLECVTVQANPSALYRLNVAQGFLAEARQNLAAGQWRACVEHCQLAVENAAKTALALLGPVPRTHDSGTTLHRTLEQGRFSEVVRPEVERLIALAGRLGADIHIAISYGDEDALLTPWDLFDESDARRAVEFANEACQSAEALMR
jgi:HEPN domain-containing protein